MAGRRSSRQRRKVDYCQFVDGSDSDDDFASAPEQQKKAKIKTQKASDAAVSRPEPQTTCGSSSPPRSGRPSREDRQWSRDVERAMKESVEEGQPEGHQEEGGERKGGKEGEEGCTPSAREEGEEKGGTVAIKEGEEGTHIDQSGKDVDSDFCPSGGEEEEEDEFVSGASDSDFDASPPAKKSKIVKTKKTAAAVAKATGKRGKAGDKEGVGGREKGGGGGKGGGKNKTEQKRKKAPSTICSPLTTPTHPSPLTTTTTPSPKSSLTSRPGAPVLGMRKKPYWTPPAAASCENHGVLKAKAGGGTPSIRVGLSRNAHVKSLHKCSPHTSH